MSRRILVTGASGRLGGALVRRLADDVGTKVIGLGRIDLDLDDPGAAERAVDSTNPNVVVHCAAWTDVDGCARDPHSAIRRNGDAVGELATACTAHGSDLVFISTNEVFEGTRTDGLGYATDDPVKPINPYGRSKAVGEAAARLSFDAGPSGRLTIIRTAWLFGPSGADFPSRIIEAAELADRSGASLRVVEDEVGCPTSSADLAQAITALLNQGMPAGVIHLVNSGVASRLEFAAEVLRSRGHATSIEPIRSADWPRASTPPRWGVLAPSRIAGVSPMRPWNEALAAYLAPAHASVPST